MLTAEGIDRRLCQCTSAALQASFPNHSVRDHHVFEVGLREGWSLARHALLTQTQHEIHGVVRDILG